MLAQLAARNFRNLEPLVWRPAARAAPAAGAELGSHLVLGGNGAGKTSLLEAVYVLATTKSFRTSQLGDCVRHGADLFHLEGEVAGDQRTRLEVGFGRDWRLRAVNGRPAPLAEHLAALPVVAWATGDSEMLSGQPVLRRRFLDRGVLGMRPAALAVLGRYRQALRQKRELLASSGQGLDAWNEVLAEAAAELIARRRAYVEVLAERLQEVLAEAGLPFPEISLRYRPSPAGGLAGAPAIRESFDRIADRERQRQLPLLGPHRDDLEIRWGEHAVGGVGSAGEKKALSLLLLAAHGRVVAQAGRSPVYLLDDADAELAPQTLAAVWSVFAGAEQLVASSNRPQVWLTLPIGSLWQMEGGRIAPL